MDVSVMNVFKHPKSVEKIQYLVIRGRNLCMEFFAVQVLIKARVIALRDTYTLPTNMRLCLGCMAVGSQLNDLKQSSGYITSIYGCRQYKQDWRFPNMEYEETSPFVITDLEYMWLSSLLVVQYGARTPLAWP
jgi:hypothetical protein